MLISGSQIFFIVSQPPFAFIFCMHFFFLKGLEDGICGKDKKRHYHV